MSQDNLIDFDAERAKRVHDLKEKRLNEMRNAFEQALPLNTGKEKEAQGQAEEALKLDAGQPCTCLVCPGPGTIDPDQFSSPDIG